jgi:DnaJ family protein C protein 11
MNESLKWECVYTKHYYSFVNTTATFNSVYDPPVLAVTAGRRLFSATTGYITYRTGEWSLFGWGGDASRKMDKSSVSLGMAGMNKQGNYSGELQVSLFVSVVFFVSPFV